MFLLLHLDTFLSSTLSYGHFSFIATLNHNPGSVLHTFINNLNPMMSVCFSLLSQHILIVQRQLSVLEEEVEEFRLALRQYINSASAQTGCLQ